MEKRTRGRDRNCCNFVYSERRPCRRFRALDVVCHTELLVYVDLCGVLEALIRRKWCLFVRCLSFFDM